jgi:transcription factor 25
VQSISATRPAITPYQITSSGTSRPVKVRSQLVRPQPTWPPAHYRAGLSMRALTPQEVDKKDGANVGDGERWWTFEASSRYKGVTFEYLQCVMGGGKQDATSTALTHCELRS